MKEYVELANQYKIGDVVIAEMGRLNADKEVRGLFFFSFSALWPLLLVTPSRTMP